MKNIPRSIWHFFQRYSGAERRVLLDTLWGIPIIHILLKRRKLRAVADWLQRRWRVPRAVTQLQPERVGELVHIASQHLPLDDTCLRRSLLLWAWLQRHYPCKIIIGVQAQDGEMRYHAWVETPDGIVLNDSPLIRQWYMPFEGAWEGLTGIQ